MEQENSNPVMPEKNNDDGGQAIRTNEPRPEPVVVTPPAEVNNSRGSEEVSSAPQESTENTEPAGQGGNKPAHQRPYPPRREFQRNGDRRGFRQRNGERNNQQNNSAASEQPGADSAPAEETAQGQNQQQPERVPQQQNNQQKQPVAKETGLTREQQQQILKDLAAGKEITEPKLQGSLREKTAPREQPIQRAPGQAKPFVQGNREPHSAPQQNRNQQTPAPQAQNAPQNNSERQGGSQQGNSQQGNSQQGNSQQGNSQQGNNQHSNQNRSRVPAGTGNQSRVQRVQSKDSNRRAPQHDNRQPRPEKSSLLSKKISIVVPLFDEEESLQPLTNEIRRALQFSQSYEVIFVDDGSRDNSLKIIKDICKSDSRFKYVSFQKNYGKSAALQVGFRHVTGEIVVTMDADLQDDPAEVYNLIKKMEEGYDLVSGWKKKRFDPFIKRHSSKFFNFMTRMMSGIKIHDFNCGLKAYKRAVVDTITVYGELHRYMPVLAHWQGFAVGELPVKHHPRKYGKTKFGISRFFKGFVDLLTVVFITRYVKRPMHFFGFFGAGFTLVGFLISLWLSIEKIVAGIPLSNRPLLILGTLLITVGIQFFSIGMIGELIVHSTQNDKEYKIKSQGL